MSDRWQCPNCKAVLQKGSANLFRARALGTTFHGTATCGACGASVSQADVYAGKYDIQTVTIENRKQYSGIPVLFLLFDIGKLLEPSNSYSEHGFSATAWTIFWKAIDPNSIKKSVLFHGSLSQYVFCIAIQIPIHQY
jgi:hypothetical protein